MSYSHYFSQDGRSQCTGHSPQGEQPGTIISDEMLTEFKGTSRCQQIKEMIRAAANYHTGNEFQSIDNGTKFKPGVGNGETV